MLAKIERRLFAKIERRLFAKIERRLFTNVPCCLSEMHALHANMLLTACAKSTALSTKGGDQIYLFITWSIYKFRQDFKVKDVINKGSCNVKQNI